MAVVIPDFNFTDELNVSDEIAESGSLLHFGHLQMHPVNVSKSFETGAYITIPGVQGGKYDEQDEDGDKKIKGWSEGGDRRLFVFVGNKESKEGESFQIIKVLKSQMDKGDPENLHPWRDYTLPAIMSLSESDRAKILAGTFAQWEDIPTGIKGELEDRETGEKKEFEYKALGSFKIFASKEEMQAAQKEHFVQFASDEPELDFTYPADWKGDSLQGMIDHIKEQKGGDMQEVATQIFTDVDGKVINDDAGSPVNWKAILSHLWDMPKPLIKATL